jgi:hypothetical protein
MAWNPVTPIENTIQMQWMSSPFGSLEHFFLPTPGRLFIIEADAMRPIFLLKATLTSALVAQAGWAQLSSSAPTKPAMATHSTEPDSLLDLPPLPKGQASLVGGTVARMDPIRDEFSVRPFGGGNVTIRLDVRTLVLRGTSHDSLRELRPGLRVYVDTIVLEGQLFAKTVRIEADPGGGELTGSVVAYDSAKQLLTISDAMSSQALTLRFRRDTQIYSGGQPASAARLAAGDLVQIAFRSASAGPSILQKVEILARPGSSFTFEGKIEVVDLRDRHLTLAKDKSDDTFEVALDSLAPEAALRLREGMNVLVRARFDGRRYQAESVEPVGTVQR